MSQQEDLLFCKIAIQSGLVSQEDARRCLAYSQKLEADGKTRPRIGSVFVKANLLSQQHVQRVYQAVHKRAGAQSIALKERAPAGRGRGVDPQAARGGQRGRQPRKREKPPRKPMDPRILWIGIGSAVAVLSAIIVISVLLFRARSDKQRMGMEEQGPSASSTNFQTRDQFTESLTGEGAKTGPTQVPMDSETRKQFETEHKYAIRDSRSMRGDSFYQALQRLEKFKNLRKNNYKMFSDLEQEIDNSIAELKQDIKTFLDETIKDAEDAASAGDKDDAKRIIEAARDRVDPETKKILDDKLKEILSG